jgi:hypothetical protein
MKTARDTLDAATSAVCGARNEDYGPPDDDFATQAAMISAYLTRSNGHQVRVTASDMAALMICVKVARQAHAAKHDNWIDVAGYAACGAECDARQATAAQ